MARFHLNLFNDIDVWDETGVDLPDLAAARVQAIAGVREVMAEQVLAGRPINLAHRIEVADEHGTVLATLPFRDLLSIVDG